MNPRLCKLKNDQAHVIYRLITIGFGNAARPQYFRSIGLNNRTATHSDTPILQEGNHHLRVTCVGLIILLISCQQFIVNSDKNTVPARIIQIFEMKTPIGGRSNSRK